jgi:hypothetical protein
VNDVVFLVDESPILKKHTQMIASDVELSDHVLLINQTLDFIDRIVREGEHIDGCHLIVLRLTVRCFNSISASLRLASMGYWQPAFAVMRDLLETYFLLDLFNSFPEKLVEWSTLNDDEITKKYSPVKVRIMLDDRDGSVQRKREKIYKMLSVHAAHPTPNGFTLISPNASTVVGPFPDQNLLLSVLQELARHVFSTGSILLNANRFETETAQRLTADLFNGVKAWRSKYNPSF